MANLVRITQRHLSERESVLQMTCKTLDNGSANPSYTELAELLPKLRQHSERTDAIYVAARAAGYRANSYAGTCVATGIKVGANGGFARKNGIGKWEVKSFGAVAKEVGVATDDLPELPDDYRRT